MGLGLQWGLDRYRTHYIATTKNIIAVNVTLTVMYLFISSFIFLCHDYRADSDRIRLELVYQYKTPESVEQLYFESFTRMKTDFNICS